MFDFARICLAVPETFVGAVDKNKEEIIARIREAEKKSVDFVLFPELALTGSTCGDLFFQRTLIEDVNTALRGIAEFSTFTKLTAILGAPVQIGNFLYNCAVVIHSGRICGVIPANHLNTDQKRWFSSAKDLDIKEIMSDEFGIDVSYSIPVCDNIVFEGKEKVKFGVLMGTDAFCPVSKGASLCLSGAEIIFTLDARGEIVGARESVMQFVKSQSEILHSVYALCSAGKDESTTDFVFAGQGIVCENGKVLCENENLIDGGYVLSCDVDLGKIRADRMKSGIFRDSQRNNTNKCDTVKLYGIEKEDSLLSDGSLYKVKKMPFVPDNKDELNKRCEQVFQMQSASLEKRLKVAGEKVVLGVSGGLDSTLALLVCVETMKRMNKSAKNIIAVTLPCFGTTERTFGNAKVLLETLGVTWINIDIKNACMQHFEDIGHDYDNKDTTFENAQARERTQVLMDVANKNGAIVCGTGDLSELVLGWCTYNADHMSMYGVNAGIPKTLIRFMIEYLATKEAFAECAKALLDIADTPISPELLPPDETGTIAQKTEDSVGPYALHDFFIYYTLRYGFAPEKIYELAKRAFDGEYDCDTIKKWLAVFYRRFFTQQFKRSCLPDGVKIGSVGVSPRGDLVMPSDAEFSDYIKRVENL